MAAQSVNFARARRDRDRERLRDEEKAEEAKLGPREAGDREQPRRWEGWGERVTNKGSV